MSFTSRTKQENTNSAGCMHLTVPIGTCADLYAVSALLHATSAFFRPTGYFLLYNI
ncbi:uncharacterized protein ASCRUDRAFT_80845 [Ascoidea rubescens DSM 1968]|uniref:Uncharacterized protein n=1 Tax=Ascoidea rubescens DSM 1968 TaxID=1344418 RepID=A0A1D2VHI4_9ASCO|nr:hypothetical protein ASCRUDRAFT_80845 [Ascoidea rubescens DSM 1968]ODV61085.1 hypothetical protein ASCRUDRAFT_80845 [Ascoidea rubescens DSM 1968]